MSKTNYLDTYETVKQRKKKFYEKYPEGTIQTQVLKVIGDGDAFLIMGMGFRGPDDKQPFIGHAYQFHDSQHNINSVAWFENGEESAVGRMLDNAGFTSNGKCSREEIEKAEAKRDNKQVETDQPQREIKEESVTKKYIKPTKNPETVKKLEKINPFFADEVNDEPNNSDLDGFAGF